MDAKTYEIKRDELVKLIDKGLALGANIPAATVEALSEVRRKVFENQFRIVLVSGFECGKSTTFNMLCDGHEISPRGLLVPTSATVVSAQNTIDDDKVGKASVVWRSDRELTMIFAKPLLRYFKAVDKDRFGDISLSDELSEELRFPEDIPLLQEVVRRQVRDILENRKRGILEESDLDAVRMAYIIANFYGDPHIVNLKAREEFTVDEVAKLITFPRKFNRDWLNAKCCAYAVDECVFAFVRQVHCYVRSENLARTGSVVIDCPGLFSSSYDTSVAFQILENADAVWYILNGRGIGDSELNALKQIIAARPHSIFYTVNLSAATARLAKEQGIPHSIQRIKEVVNVDLSPSDFNYYHALIALSAVQAKQLEVGGLTQHDKDELSRIADNQFESNGYGRSGTRSPDRIVRKTLKGALNTAYGIDIEDVEVQCNLTGLYDECLKISGVDSVLAAIESEVVSKKAKSILVDNGSRKAIDLIRAVENVLELQEAVKREERTNRNDEYEHAKTKLEKFKMFCDQCLSPIRDGEGAGVIDHSLAMDYWQEVINSSIEEVAEQAAEKIVTYDLNELRQGLSEQIVNDTFAEIVKPKAVAWANQIKSGTSEQFNRFIGVPMKQIIRDTSREWEIVIQGEPMLQNLPTPIPVAGTEVLNTELIDRVVASAPGVSGDVIVGASIGAAIGAFIGSWIFPVVGTYVGGAIGGILGAIFEGGLNENQRRQQIQDSLCQKLRQFVADPTNMNKVVSMQQVRIEELRLNIVQEFETAFSKPLVALIEQYEMAQRMLADKTVEENALVQENNIFREKKLKPLRLEIEDFERSLEDKSDEWARII